MGDLSGNIQGDTSLLSSVLKIGPDLCQTILNRFWPGGQKSEVSMGYSRDAPGTHRGHTRRSPGHTMGTWNFWAPGLNQRSMV